MDSTRIILKDWLEETHLSFVVNKTTIYCFEVQVFGNFSMDKHSHQSTICHHELPKHIGKAFSHVIENATSDGNTAMYL